MDGKYLNLEVSEMTFITFKEFCKDDEDPSIQDYLEEGPYPNQDKIIHFLKNGKIEFAQMSRDRDIFTGNRIPYEVLVMSDGDYFWANTLAWYVENYNLRMPEEFEAYILSKCKE